MFETTLEWAIDVLRRMVEVSDVNVRMTTAYKDAVALIERFDKKQS